MPSICKMEQREDGLWVKLTSDFMRDKPTEVSLWSDLELRERDAQVYQRAVKAINNLIMESVNERPLIHGPL